MFTSKSKRVSLLLIVLALSSAFSNCSRYYEEKLYGLGAGGNDRRREIAGETKLSPPVTEIKLPKDFAVRDGFMISLYISGKLDYGANKIPVADKDCFEVRGMVCLKNGLKAKLSGSLVDENGEVRELHPSISLPEAASLDDIPPDGQPPKDFNYKSYTILRIQTSEPITVDHIVMFNGYVIPTK